MTPLRCDQLADGVLVLEINRPEVLNAVSVEVQTALERRLTEAENDAAVRCLVLCGAGDRAFSAGWDIHQLAQMSEEQHTLVQLEREEWLWHWASTPIPTVVALQGITYGVGALLAVTADLRVGCAETRFKITASQYGGANLTWVLDELIGWSRTKDLLMTSRLVEGAEAERIGLLNRLVEFADVRQAAIALASQVAALPPEGVRAVKQLLQAGPGRDLRARFDAENTAMMTTVRPGPMTDVFSSFLATHRRRS
jgi:2-(1,2-epoxy-1,2-dihydrophenyl)acetyl-CoA isomerase